MAAADGGRLMEAPLTWFVIRSSGVVAVVLLTASVVSGLVAPRLRPTARLVAISAHRAAALAGSVLVAVHVTLAVLDGWIDLDWSAVVVPGAAAWEPLGVGLGALAVDLFIALLVTTWIRRRAPRLWRRTHLVAYPLWVLCIGHGLLVGTDQGVMRPLALACVAVVLLGLAVRLLRAPHAMPTTQLEGMLQ